MNKESIKKLFKLLEENKTLPKGIKSKLLKKLEELPEDKVAEFADLILSTRNTIIVKNAEVKSERKACLKFLEKIEPEVTKICHQEVEKYEKDSADEIIKNI